MATNKNEFLDYDIPSGTNRGAEAEWPPHKAQTPIFTEWHYWTSILEGTNGHRYFLFLCDFNCTGDLMKGYIQAVDPSFDVPEGKSAFMFQTILSDYNTGHSISDFDASIQDHDDTFDFETNTKKFRGPKYAVDMTYKGDDVLMKAKGPKYSVNLTATGGKKVMWAQDQLGIEGLIREGGENDRSFYYSLPDLPFHGSLSYEENGEWISTEVTGRGWVDRQWGDFEAKAWEWSSFRFADGSRVNLYNFAGGYQVGTYMNEDGDCEYFDDFTVYQNGYGKTPDGVWFSHGWDYDLPVKGKKYTVEPLSKNNIMIAPGNSFFEGIGKLMDENGNQVGWAVNESMDVRVMENAPGQRFQNNRT